MGADITIPGNGGMIPIQAASIYGNIDVVKLLLEKVPISTLPMTTDGHP